MLSFRTRTLFTDLRDVSMRNAELIEKLEEIRQKFGITIRWIGPGETNRANRANRATKTIWIKEVKDSGDFAVGLHEVGHVMCDPEEKPKTDRERLDADTKAWQWALEQNGGNFDADGWTRLHASLHQYYVSVMDPAHPAYKLLVTAEEQVPTIRPKVSSFGAPTFTSLPKKSTKPKQ